MHIKQQTKFCLDSKRFFVPLSRAWHGLRVFPCLIQNFHAVGAGFMFYLAWQRIFVRFSTGFMFEEREIKPFPLWKWIKSRFGEREVLTQQVHTSLWHSIGWTSNNFRKICRIHVQVVLKDTKKGRKQIENALLNTDGITSYHYSEKYHSPD